MRSYRDTEGDGQITFARAFAVGVLITLITCVCYVVTWEVLYFNFLHGFMDKYTGHMIEKAQPSGASAAAIQAKVQQLNNYKEQYEKLWFNAAVTFLEPFSGGPGDYSAFLGHPAEEARTAGGCVGACFLDGRFRRLCVP